MVSSRLRRLAPAPAIIAVLGVTACGVSKSANPLSPSVAGPIPGVNITAPIAIQAPIPTAPITNVIVTTTHPQFTFGNAPRSGTVGTISYVIEISTIDSFAAKVAAWTVGEQTNQTSLTAPQDLGGSTQYFW